jgi:hypothetical protein
VTEPRNSTGISTRSPWDLLGQNEHHAGRSTGRKSLRAAGVALGLLDDMPQFLLGGQTGCCSEIALELHWELTGR